MALKAKTIAEAFVEIMERTPSPRTGKPPMRGVELSKILGINPSNVSRIANPAINQLPSDEILQRLANAFPELTTYDDLLRIRDNSPASARRRGPKARRSRPRRADVTQVGEARPTQWSSLEVKTEEHASRETIEEQRHASMATAQSDLGSNTSAATTTVLSEPGRRGSFFAGVPLPRGARPPAGSEGMSSTPAVRDENNLAVREKDMSRFELEASRPRRMGGLEARPLIAEHLPTIGSFVRSLREIGSAGEVISADLRFAVAASIALTEFERAVGDQGNVADTHAAASVLINDLWRLALGGRMRDQDELQPRDLPSQDRERFEAFLSVVPDRQESYHRIVTILGPLLFPGGANTEDLDRLRMVVLRAFVVGAQR